MKIIHELIEYEYAARIMSKRSSFATKIKNKIDVMLRQNRTINATHFFN